MTAAPPAWAVRRGDDWRLTIRVQPGAGRTGVVGTHDDALKVRVAAPANEGKANAELIRFLATTLAVPRRAVVVVLGATARTKVIEVPGTADPTALLGERAAEPGRLRRPR